MWYLFVLQVNQLQPRETICIQTAVYFTLLSVSKILYFAKNVVTFLFLYISIGIEKLGVYSFI